MAGTCAQVQFVSAAQDTKKKKKKLFFWNICLAVPEALSPFPWLSTAETAHIASLVFLLLVEFIKSPQLVSSLGVRENMHMKIGYLWFV